MLQEAVDTLFNDILPSPFNALRYAQLLPQLFLGLIIFLDILHGKFRPLAIKWGYPGWFPVVLGSWKLMQTYLNWARRGRFIWLAQGMFAFQLGGALYTHIMVDGRIQDCLMLFIYLANSCAVQYLFGYYGILHQLVAFVLGYMCGYVVTAIGVADIMQQAYDDHQKEKEKEQAEAREKDEGQPDVVDVTDDDAGDAADAGGKKKTS